jgi:hypothetical protein
MRPRLASHIIDLGVVSGGMIDATIIVRPLQRRHPDAAAAAASLGGVARCDVESIDGADA